MKSNIEHCRLNEKLKVLKKIIGEINSDVVMLINFSAQIENKLKTNGNLSGKQANSLERKLSRVIKTYLKNYQK